MPLSDAATAFARRRNVPSDLLSKDWTPVEGWLRERAFFMAGVEDANQLQSFRREVRRILDSESGGTESMERLRIFLEESGFQPSPDVAGTIQDISTANRMAVSIDTNVKMARGFGRLQRLIKSAQAFPALMFTRTGSREEPRLWANRWRIARALTSNTPGATDVIGSDDEPGAALIGHPIWRALSRFDQPYPPFDWGSGMGVKPLTRKRTRSLGILTDNAEELLGREKRRSLNETLEARPDVQAAGLRSALEARMGGLAEWDGGVLRSTDPNGTRTATGQQLFQMWSTMPVGLALFQRDSLLDWFADESSIEPETSKWDDVQRVLDRIQNERDARRLWRGTRMTGEDFDEFLQRLENEGYQIPDTIPAELYTDADEPTHQEGDDWSVILEVDLPKKASDLTELAPEKKSSWAYRTGQRFAAQGTAIDRESKTATIILEEAKP